MHSHNEFEHESFFRLDRLPELPPRYTPPIYGDARMATAADLAPYLNRPDENHPCLLPDVSFLLEAPDGRSLTALYKKPFYLPADIRTRNLLVVGQIGSYKTQQIIVPMVASDIEDRAASVVVIDVKGDLHQKLTPLVQRRRPGTAVRVLNLTDPRRTTHGWNPFDAMQGSATALEDAQNFCLASDTPGRKYDSPFWDGSAARFIAADILRRRKLYGRVCPADVQHDLELPQKELLDLLKAHPDVPFAPAVAAFISSGSHNAETVLATAQMYLRSLLHSGLAAVTSVSEMAFEELFTEPTVLVLELSQGDLDTVRPFVNLFFSQLFRAACAFAERQPGCRLPRPLNLYLDDMAVGLGRVPQLGLYLNVLRSRNVRVVAAVQSLRQLDHYYDTEAESVISGFATKIFKSPVERYDAQWASQQSGTCTVEVIQESRGAEVPPWDGEAPRRTVYPVGRPLLLPEQVRLAPDHFLLGRASTVFPPDVPPLQCWFRAAHDLPGLAEDLARAMHEPRPEALRDNPLVWQLPPLGAVVRSDNGFTNTRGMSDEQILDRLQEVKQKLDWDNTTGSARKWWEAFENENKHRLGLVVRLTEELANRKATITEFFLAYVYSNTDNIQANLHYLDYTRLKKEEDRKKREAAQRAREVGKRFRSNQVCPSNAGGTYRFDRYLHDRSAANPREVPPVPVRVGEKFPLCPFTCLPCWWRRAEE